MATKRSGPAGWVISQWEHNCGYSSAVFSGFEPDRSHLDTGGYHCSIIDLIAFGNGGDYSNTRPDDKGFNPEYGSAIDMSMSPADMKLCHSRVHAVYSDRTDPRRQYINAINCWSGSGSAVRLDMYANTSTFASADHQWHNHAEFRRRWNNSWTAADAYVSVLKGETKADFIARTAQGGAPMAKIVSILDGPVKGGLYASGGSGYWYLENMDDLRAYAAAWGISSTVYENMSRSQAEQRLGPFLGTKTKLDAPAGPKGEPGTNGKDGTNGADGVNGADGHGFAPGQTVTVNGTVTVA